MLRLDDRPAPIRNSFISWASDFYGHNDMDYVSLLPVLRSKIL